MTLCTDFEQNRLTIISMSAPVSQAEALKSCVKIDQSTLTGLFSCNKRISQGDGLSPVLFSLFMNDLPQYFKQNNCPGVVLGNQLLNI